MISTRSQATTRVLLLVGMMVFAVLPLISMLSAALAPKGTVPVGLAWPTHPRWQNFTDAWQAADLTHLYLSSALIAVGVVPAAVALSTLAGYALAQLNVPGGRAIYVLFLFGLALPFEALITPLYYDVRAVGLLNSRWAVILPLIALLMPFGVFWMRAHFLDVERSLTEAAMIDGASPRQVFLRIHLPLAVPAWSALTILFFLATWNQYLLPLVLIENPSHRTVAGGLGAFQGEHGTDVALLCAGSLLIIVPTLVVFIAFQRHFVRALMQGAVK